jgi:predicted nucleotidyltransferase
MTLPRTLDLPPKVSRILDQVVDTCREDFEGLVDSVYLSGSQLEGVATPGSDIDLIVVMTGEASLDDVDRLRSSLYAIPDTGDPELGALFLSLEAVRAGMPEYARSAHLILGDGRLEAAPRLCNRDAYRRWVGGALRLSAMVRGSEGGLREPLTRPDCSPWGYFVSERGGASSTKNLVSLVARISGALVIRGTGVQPASKSVCFELYADMGDGSFSPWALEFYQSLNQRWGYRIPQEESSREEFHELLRGLPEFENHFLDEVRADLEAAGDSADERDRQWVESCMRVVQVDLG